MNSEDSQEEHHKKLFAVMDVSRLESEFQSRQEDKYKQVNNRMLSIEKELLHTKDEMAKINQNINIILEEQNNQYNLILEECRSIINNKIVDVFCGAGNPMHQHVPSNQNNSMIFSLNNNNDDNISQHHLNV